MYRIVFLDRSTIAPQTRLRRPAFERQLVEHANTRPEEVVARLKGASVAILNKVPMPASVLEQLPDLRLIAVAATGTAERTARRMASRCRTSEATRSTPCRSTRYGLILRAAQEHRRLSRS